MTYAQPDYGRQDGASPLAAMVPRTAALLILLYQIRLLASDLADTSFFLAALAGALVSAIFLYRKRIRPLQAVFIIALVPWTIRFFIALPRWFMTGVSGNALVLDSLLLNLDRNNFTVLLPFYWTAASTYFSRRSRIFLRADIIAADTFFLVLFSIVNTAGMDAYRWPVLMIALFALVLFLQIFSMVLSLPPELKLRRKEKTLASVFLFLLIFLGGAFFIRPFQERAVERGGGLLEPNLFRFDFSQILRLESEISVNDDLVMIVRKDPEDYHILLRRYTLSGYSPKQGFFRLKDTDEAAHPKNLPGGHTILPADEIRNFSVTDQEYYLVNFDASAFIGMNMPVEITPFESWDASSFNSAYAVRSHTSEALPFELIDAVEGDALEGKTIESKTIEGKTIESKSAPEKLGLSAEEYALYTEYGGDEAIAAFAREITGRRNSLSYWEQIEMVYDRLKYGEYRYSLKPGIAPDGDQLKYFLFRSKKGYCSYYAFAFTLMLRSLGIPCRVAAGFFLDPSTEAFNYYPVRTDMAHAWVEVWFPEYGWIEYDPTSEIMAEGEEFRFSQGTPPELFERLIKEILENRSRLREREGEEKGNGQTSLGVLGKKTLDFLANRGPILGGIILIVIFLAIRSGYMWLAWLHKNPGKKARYLWAHTKRRLALAGFSQPSFSSPSAAGEAEWAKFLDHSFSGLYLLYQDNAAARFAPAFSAGDSRNMKEHYRLFSGEYSKVVPPGRRLLAWLLPPLAMIPKSAGIVMILILLLLLRMDTGGAQDNPASQNADRLYDNAMAAQQAENWETAIELFSTGTKTYPYDIRFPLSLGNLYYNRSLYHLAWDEYRRAERINPWAPDLLFRLAYTAGYLNRNDASADYLERILTLEPENMEAISTLGWMYFKTHRLPEGERLLLNAISHSGNDADFAMTLGFIYSDLFQYDNARNYYLEAIKGAEAIGDRLTTAIAYYNLSILESRFYRFSLAYDSTNSSLEAMNRSPGRLARGELYLRRMELPRVLGEYQEAYGMDSSPLSKLNLAQAYQTGGRLSEAMLYAEDCLNAGDHSWMLNYGIDPVRYRRDIHEVLKDTYKGLLEAEYFSRCGFWYAGTIKERVQSLFRAISYRFRWAVNQHLFRKYSLLAADAYSEGSGGAKNEIHLDALIQYFNAFEDYPRRALVYLRQARTFEEPLIPGSVPSYNLEEGRLSGDRKLLTEALLEFDPLWERDMISEVYAELAAKGSKAGRQDAAERLFALNRGALPQNGIRLPALIQIDSSVIHVEGVLSGAARAAGIEAVSGGAPRYVLKFASGGEGIVSCELYDGGRGTAIWKQNLPMPSYGQRTEIRKNREAFADFLREGIFNAF